MYAGNKRHLMLASAATSDSQGQGLATIPQDSNSREGSNKRVHAFCIALQSLRDAIVHTQAQAVSTKHAK